MKISRSFSKVVTILLSAAFNILKLCIRSCKNVDVKLHDSLEAYYCTCKCNTDFEYATPLM